MGFISFCSIYQCGCIEMPVVMFDELRNRTLGHLVRILMRSKNNDLSAKTRKPRQIQICFGSEKMINSQMNFLAHAYLSFYNPPVLVGNMIADFVKGKKSLNRFPETIQAGIV